MSVNQPLRKLVDLLRNEITISIGRFQDINKNIKAQGAVFAGLAAALGPKPSVDELFAVLYANEIDPSEIAERIGSVNERIWELQGQIDNAIAMCQVAAKKMETAIKHLDQ